MGFEIFFKNRNLLESLDRASANLHNLENFESFFFFFIIYIRFESIRIISVDSGEEAKRRWARACANTADISKR